MVKPEEEENIEIKYTVEAQQTQRSEDLSGQQEQGYLELRQSVSLMRQGTVEASAPPALSSWSETPGP